MVGEKGDGGEVVSCAAACQQLGITALWMSNFDEEMVVVMVAVKVVNVDESIDGVTVSG